MSEDTACLGLYCFAGGGSFDSGRFVNDADFVSSRLYLPCQFF
jgi:hypothetical protein